MTSTFKISAKSVFQTPRKAGEVAALIRRHTLNDALVILEHTPRRAAGHFSQLLKSAQAAAKDVHRLELDSLTVEDIFVTPGPVFKRHRRQGKHFRSMGRGRAMAVIPWNKRSSHIFVSIAGQPKKAKAKAASAPSPKTDKEQPDGTKS